MLEDFQTLEIFTPSIFDIAGNLLVAFVCGLIISYVYRFTYRGPNYSATFVSSLVLLAMITSVVILVIGNNLARAFGLVGAMSIIRFRTAVRDTQDIVFIFFALTVGMAAGVGLTFVAIIATLFISLIILLLSATEFASRDKKQHLLQITYDGSGDHQEQLQKVLKKYCRRTNLVNIKNLGYNDELEVFYHIKLRGRKKAEDFTRDLNGLGFISNVNLYFDEAE